MHEIFLKMESNEDIYKLFDKNLDFIYIPNFNPNSYIEWWKTDIKTKSGKILENVSVRNFTTELQVGLKELEQIINLNQHQLVVYQFDREIPDSLQISYLPENNRLKILEENGLKHYFFLNFEFAEIESFDENFIEKLKTEFSDFVL